MISVHHIPSPPLSSFVRLFWYYDGYVQPHPRERLLPGGTMSLVVNLREDHIRTYDTQTQQNPQTIRGHVLSGARSNFFVVDTRNMVHTIGVQFRPGGGFPFLKMPADEVTGQSLSLDQLWGEAGQDLRVRLLEAATPQRMFRVVELWLLQQLARPMERHRAVSYALTQFQQGSRIPSVGELVARLGISQRRFIQLFTAEVGLTPKVFSRVMRFQRAVNTIGNRDDVDWASLALDCGYYDQAHFIHDFQAFSGIPPSAYLAHKTAHLNHVPEHD